MEISSIYAHQFTVWWDMCKISKDSIENTLCGHFEIQNKQDSCWARDNCVAVEPRTTRLLSWVKLTCVRGGHLEPRSMRQDYNHLGQAKLCQTWTWTNKIWPLNLQRIFTESTTKCDGKAYGWNFSIEQQFLQNFGQKIYLWGDKMDGSSTTHAIKLGQSTRT